MNESTSVVHLMSALLLFLSAVCVVTAFPVHSKPLQAGRNLIERAASRKTSDIDSIRRLLLQRTNDKQRIASRRFDVSGFDDEDPLHVILGSAANIRPAYDHRRSAADDVSNVAKVKKSNAARDGRRHASRFLEAIGIAPYPMGTSGSDSFDYRPYGSSSSSSSNYDGEEYGGDNDGEYEYYWVECDEDDEDCYS